MSDVTIPVAVGELLDKISILEIKAERIADDAKLANIRREYDTLQAVWQATGLADAETNRLQRELKSVNEALWQIEDAIRDEERGGRFGDRFIELARSVYRRNDERAELKRAINTHTGSTLVEEKSYQAY